MACLLLPHREGEMEVLRDPLPLQPPPPLTLLRPGPPGPPPPRLTGGGVRFL